MKKAVLLGAIWVLGALVFGCMWQIEIAYLNIYNEVWSGGLVEYPFMYFFNTVSFNNWAAKDCFYLVQGVAWFFTVVVAYLLGREK